MLSITTTDEIEQRLSHEAERLGIAADDYAFQLLDKHLPYGEDSALHQSSL